MDIPWKCLVFHCSCLLFAIVALLRNRPIILSWLQDWWSVSSFARICSFSIRAWSRDRAAWRGSFHQSSSSMWRGRHYYSNAIWLGRCLRQFRLKFLRRWGLSRRTRYHRRRRGSDCRCSPSFHSPRSTWRRARLSSRARTESDHWRKESCFANSIHHFCHLRLATHCYRASGTWYGRSVVLVAHPEL